MERVVQAVVFVQFFQDVCRYLAFGAEGPPGTLLTRTKVKVMITNNTGTS